MIYSFLKYDSCRPVREDRAVNFPKTKMNESPPQLKLKLTAVSEPPVPRFVYVEEVVDGDTMQEWASSLCTLMNLTWSYVDTILDMCALMKLKATKPLARQVRDLKRRYDQFRHTKIDDETERLETQTAEDFEDMVRKHLSRLFNALDFEMSKLDLKDDWKALAISVHQAMTLMEAVTLYARRCDAEIRKRGVAVKDRCMVQEEFIALYPLIPQFAGDCYIKNLSACTITANILVNEMVKLELNICR